MRESEKLNENKSDYDYEEEDEEDSLPPMKNRKFHFLLRTLRTATGKRWTVGRIAETIYVGRSRLNDVLNNTPGQGALTRPKVVRFLGEHLADKKAELLEALGWDLEGNPKDEGRNPNGETFNIQQPNVGLASTSNIQGPKKSDYEDEDEDEEDSPAPCST